LAQEPTTKTPGWLTPEVKHIIAFVGATVAIAVLNMTSDEKYQLTQAPKAQPPPNAPSVEPQVAEAT